MEYHHCYAKHADHVESRMRFWVGSNSNASPRVIWEVVAVDSGKMDDLTYVIMPMIRLFLYG